MNLYKLTLPILFSTWSSILQAGVCSSAVSDIDGDGLGVENGLECTVVIACQSSQSDSDGDGWGWENQRSCVVTTRSGLDAKLPCLDTDGDGWGWNGRQSCLDIVGSPVVPAAKCMDTPPLHDGWGWDGKKSCKVSSAAGYTLSDVTDVVLVTGQSNTLGSNTIVAVGPDDPNEKVFAWTENGWAVADLHQVWDLGWHPRTTPDGKHPHNNFALHFGKVLAENSDRVVAFLVLSAPGRPISHWDSDKPFFRKIRFQVEAALAELPHPSQISAILWHQGENDWYGGNQYRSKLNALISNFRQEQWFSPSGVFICGETYKAPVNADLDALNNDGDLSTACVSSAGLGVQGDQVHFDASGLRVLGKRYAEKYQAILEGDLSSR